MNMLEAEFYKILEEYKEDTKKLSAMLLDKDILEKEVHFISYPFRRKPMPADIREKVNNSQTIIYSMDDDIDSLNDKITKQKRAMKNMTENDR